jgi:ribonucleoside-diphosphate reductase alpha subunit
MSDWPISDVIYVINRKNQREKLNPIRIAEHIETLAAQKPAIPHINAQFLMIKACECLKTNITTYELNEQVARIAADLSLTNPYYLSIAGRIAINNHHKETKPTFAAKIAESADLMRPEFIDFVTRNEAEIEALINYDLDYELDFFGFRTFQRQYSMKKNSMCVERPQDMFMRTAIALSLRLNKPFNKLVDKLSKHETAVMTNVRQTYYLLSHKIYTHASPTYYNAGLKACPQYASCFLMGCGDSCEAITSTVAQMAKISKYAGGIGLFIHELRGSGARIHGTNGVSSGIVPFVRMFETTMKAFNQGGRRPGSAKIYLQMHHPDLISFIELRKNAGDELLRARSLFYALWVPDLFMQRVRQDNGMWSLFDPSVCGDLSDLHNAEYTERYIMLENAKQYTCQMSARKIWEMIAAMNAETGMPDIIFSDTANRCNMQSNLGTLKSSNLCDEIYQYSCTASPSRPEEIATCILASVSLGACVVDRFNLDQPQSKLVSSEFPVNPVFDFEKLGECVKQIVYNLNNLIDDTYHPVDASRYGCLKQRAIGIGVQGLNDCYMKMGFAFNSPEAHALNKEIFEAIYYYALWASAKAARAYRKEVISLATNGAVYDVTYKSSEPQVILDNAEVSVDSGAYHGVPFDFGACAAYHGGPLSRGLFHWELCGLKPENLSGRFDWDSLREFIKKFGVRNSLTTALMPTASTSQLLGNTECFEPVTSNVYKRETSAGEFIVINKYMIRDLFALKLWNDELREYIIAAEGSIQYIDGIPQTIKDKYKTAYEIDQAVLIQQAIDRQPFVDQGQSMNLFVTNASLKEWTRLMFLGWRGGLKTGKYYYHTAPASMPTKFSIDPTRQKEMLEIIKAQQQLKTTGSASVKSVACDGCSA